MDSPLRHATTAQAMRAIMAYSRFYRSQNRYYDCGQCDETCVGCLRRWRDDTWMEYTPPSGHIGQIVEKGICSIRLT